MNDTIRSVLVSMFREQATQEEACAEAGISISTLKREMQRSEAFLNEITRAQNFANRVARQSLIRAMGTDGRLALRYLERTDPRFQPKPQGQSTDEQRAAALQRIIDAGISAPSYPEIGDGLEWPHSNKTLRL